MLKCDSASTQQAPPISRPAAVSQALELRAAVSAQIEKPMKAQRTITSLASIWRSRPLSSAPTTAPRPKAPSMMP